MWNPNSIPFVPYAYPAIATTTFTDTQLSPYYQPLGLTHEQVGLEAAEEVIPSAEWTPIWSDIFKVAEKQDEEKEVCHFEELEMDRFYRNLALCNDRTLHHVRPQPQFDNIVNVENLEKVAFLQRKNVLISEQ